MAVIVPAEGENICLNIIKAPGSYSGYAIYCALFQSNTTPSASTVLADLTECNFSGYAAVSVTWGTVAQDGGGKASMTGTQIDFTHDGGGTPNDVYGWYLYFDNAGAVSLLAIERFASPPVVMDDNTDIISITPTFKLFD